MVIADFSETARVRKEIRTEETVRKETRKEKMVRTAVDLIITEMVREDSRDRIVRRVREDHRDRTVRREIRTADLENVPIMVRKAANLIITETV